MTTVTVTPDVLRLELSRFEKVAGLLRDLEVPLSSVRSATVEPDGLRAVRGLRAPGLDLPRVRKIGTWRRRGHKTLVAVRRGEPALRLELEGARFDEVLVSTERAAEYAKQLARA